MRARTPVDDREQGCIEEFLAAIDRLGDDPFDEHANPIHVTASALIVGRNIRRDVDDIAFPQRR